MIVEQGACQIRAEYFSQKLFHVIGNKEAVSSKQVTASEKELEVKTIIISDKLKRKASKV